MLHEKKYICKKINPTDRQCHLKKKEMMICKRIVINKLFRNDISTAASANFSTSSTSKSDFKLSNELP
jgi:hypothetical protein